MFAIQTSRPSGVKLSLMGKLPALGKLAVTSFRSRSMTAMEFA